MISFLAARFGLSKPAIYATLIVLAFLAVATVMLLADRNGYNRADAKWQARMAKAEAAFQRVVTIANDRAAEQRAVDTERLNTVAQERTDAIQSAPPSRTGAATARLGCVRLRAAGRHADADAAGCARQ